MLVSELSYCLHNDRNRPFFALLGVIQTVCGQFRWQSASAEWRNGKSSPQWGLVTAPLLYGQYVLAERAQRPIAWPPCPTCGTSLRSKGFAQRQLTSLVGPLRWRRRVGRCPHGCDIPQGAPLAEARGVQPHQRTSGELQCLGCALAVFVPCATAARLLG